MHKILVVRLSALGDIIHCLPAISDLHRRWPQAQIDMAVDERFSEIPALHTGLHRIIALPLKRLKKNLFQRSTPAAIGRLLSELRRERYDLIIDMHGLWKSALVSRLARGRERVGFHRSQCAETPAAWFYARHYRPEQPVPSRVQWIRELVAFASQGQCDTPADFGLGEASLANREKTAVLFHSTSRAEKLWPETNWQQVIRHLLQAGYQVELPWGSEDERERAQRLCRQLESPHCVVTGPLSLGEWQQRLQAVSLVVGLDTGLTHLAAAIGTPCVAIYTATEADSLVAQRPDMAMVLGGPGSMPGATDVMHACDRMLMRLKVYPL